MTDFFWQIHPGPISSAYNMPECINEAFHHFLNSTIGPLLGLVPQCPHDHLWMCPTHATGFEQSGQPKNETVPCFIGPQLVVFTHLLQYQPLNCGWYQTGSPHSGQAQ